MRCCKEPIKVLVCRRYASTLRNTCFALFKEVLKKWKLTPYVKIRETDFNIQFSNGSEIIFMGLDIEEKLLSLSNVSTVWIEEVFEVEKEKVEQLNLRMRGTADNQQIIMSWNPISKSSYLYDFTVENPPNNSIFIHSTYKDNPFLNKEYVNSLEELEVRNPSKYKIFTLGQWGSNPDGLVFTNWFVEDLNDMELAQKGLEHRSGMDFGYRDESAIIETFYDRENKTIYIVNEFIKAGCQLDALEREIKNLHLEKSRIWADSAEPRTIDFFRSKGINMKACIKGQNSVDARIAFLQNNKLVVSRSCIKFIEELENFSYIKDKMTDKYTNKYTHEWSHGIDACGYAYSDIYTNRKVKTFSKDLLGL